MRINRHIRLRSGFSNFSQGARIIQPVRRKQLACAGQRAVINLKLAGFGKLLHNSGRRRTITIEQFKQQTFKIARHLNIH